MLVTVNKIKHMALHGSYPSQTLFRVSNEKGPVLFSRFLDKNSLKELLAVGPKKRAERKGVERKEN